MSGVIVRESVAPEWVVVSEGRQSRPLTGDTPGPGCPFCPGAETEVGGEPFSAAVFANRFPPFTGHGCAEVVVYSPNHFDDLAYLSAAHADLIWEVWTERTASLARRPDVAQVFVFENRGRRVGASIAHPHGQIYGYPEVSPRLQRERAVFSAGCPVCADGSADRTVLNTAAWRLVAPPAPRMPFELWLVPRRHQPGLGGLSVGERREGATLMQAVLRAYDERFGHRAALVLALYQDIAPEAAAYHWRLDFLPWERGGGRHKYLAGSELAMDAFLTDVAPETTVAQLSGLVRRQWERRGGGPYA